MLRTTTILWLALAICAGLAFVPVASAQSAAEKENLLFTRVYVKREGRWRLLSSTQLVAFNY
jgi:hypothetical protein